NRRLSYSMLQTITLKSNWPHDFGSRMKSYIADRLADIKSLIAENDSEIPGTYWIELDELTKVNIDLFVRDVRLLLKDEGILDEDALRLLWSIRCRDNPAHSECNRPE